MIGIMSARSLKDNLLWFIGFSFQVRLLNVVSIPNLIFKNLEIFQNKVLHTLNFGETREKSGPLFRI